MGKQNQKGQIVYVDCDNQATHKGILVPHHKYMHIGQKLQCPHIPHHHFRSYAESEHLRLLLKNKKFSLVDLVAYRHKIKKSKLCTLSENEKWKISIIEELAPAKKDGWRLHWIKNPLTRSWTMCALTSCSTD